MTEQRVRPFLLSLLALGLVLGGCDLSGSNGGPELVKGPEVSVEGGGMAYAYTRVGSDGQPKSVGVALSKTGYESLISGDDGHTNRGHSAKHDSVTAINVQMPEQAPAPYDHVSILWNPEGHPPEGVYTVPHIGMHFFFISPEKREAIKPGPAETLPDEKYLPDGYKAGGGGMNVPGLGVNYFDPNAPEFNGEPFTHTLIYGFYKGESTFINPMLANSFLSSRPSVTSAVPQPEAYQKSGMYPKRYRVTFNKEADEYRIVLEDLVRKEGS